jgi:hypothetical protein
MAQQLHQVAPRCRRYQMLLFEHDRRRRAQKHRPSGRHPRRHAQGQGLLTSLSPQPHSYVVGGIRCNDNTVWRSSGRIGQETRNQLGHASQPPGNETIEHGSDLRAGPSPERPRATSHGEASNGPDAPSRCTLNLALDSYPVCHTNQAKAARNPSRTRVVAGQASTPYQCHACPCEGARLCTGRSPTSSLILHRPSRRINRLHP